uniref:Uncharacterized protein n=1 Tax=Strigamia maritima TaxID=126957 RepID=T1IU71_STRMM
MINTFYYIDDELLMWWEEECNANKNQKRQMAAIGFRDLKDVEKNEEKVNSLYEQLRGSGGTTDKIRLNHKNCQYPPKMENPYLKSKQKGKNNYTFELCTTYFYWLIQGISQYLLFTKTYFLCLSQFKFMLKLNFTLQSLITMFEKLIILLNTCILHTFVIHFSQ